jgi:hypothetical protein
MVTLLCLSIRPALSLADTTTGHLDGRVSGFTTLPSEQLARRAFCWQAHKSAAVTALATTPWGELWTGSSRGSIRVWPAACRTFVPEGALNNFHERFAYRAVESMKKSARCRNSSSGWFSSPQEFDWSALQHEILVY